MAAIYMRDVDFKIANTQYSGSVTSVLITPTYPKSVAPTLNKDVTYAAVGTPTWTSDIAAYFEENVGSLADALWDSQGKEITITFTPAKGTSGRIYTIKVIAEAMAIGGAMNSHPIASVSLQVVGQPVRGAYVTAA